MLAQGAAIPIELRAQSMGCRGWASIVLARIEDGRRDPAELVAVVKSLP